MGISKDWLNEKIKNSVKELEDQQDAQRIAFSLGKKEAYQNCYNELTKAPLTKDQIVEKKKLKNLDPDKTYEDIVRYYIDKKGYSKEHANEIAQTIVKEQQQKRL